jgi:Protein of unknown function (DUF4230)
MTFKHFRTIVYIIILLFVLYGLFRFVSTFSFSGITKPAAVVRLNQAAVITEIQSLAKLETASYTIEKIIEAGVQGNVFQNILYGDKILLIAHANIVAGFDLAKLQAGDVIVDGSRLTIHLQSPEVLYSRLDNEQTRVYDRKRGLFTKGDSQLESEARVAAEQSIRKAACDGGILTVAAENGRKQFQTMFSTAGFSDVVIDIPVGMCQ